MAATKASKAKAAAKATPHTAAGAAAAGQATKDPDAIAPVGTQPADVTAPEQSGKVTEGIVRQALYPAIDAGAASARAIAKQLSGVDFVAMPEDAAADAVMAAVEQVTEAGDATGGAPRGQGARLNHGQAILVAQAIRRAVSE